MVLKCVISVSEVRHQMIDIEDIKKKALKALDKPAKYGVDLDINKYPPPPSIKNREELLKQSSHLLASIGIKSKEASYIQVDEDPLEIQTDIPGVRLFNLEAALKEGLVDDYFWKVIPVDADKYTAAAELYGRHQGYVVIVEKRAKIDRPISTCLLMSTPNSIQAPHNIIVVEEGAELHATTGCLAMMEKAGLHAGISEFYVKKGGRLTYTMIHQWAYTTHVRPRTSVIVEEGGEYISHYINMTPVASLQTDPRVYLVGKGAKAYLSSVIVSKKSSNMDIGGTVYLKSPETTAEIISKTVTKDEANVITRSLISAEAPSSKGHIECDGLLLSENSRILTLPALDAKINDVQLSHEAAVGRLNEEQIYYLMSRGFTEDEATSMLVRGFMEVKLENIPDILKLQIKNAIRMAAAGL